MWLLFILQFMLQFSNTAWICESVLLSMSVCNYTSVNVCFLGIYNSTYGILKPSWKCTGVLSILARLSAGRVVLVLAVPLLIKPNTHRRRRRDETVESRRVGGVYTPYTPPMRRNCFVASVSAV